MKIEFTNRQYGTLPPQQIDFAYINTNERYVLRKADIKKAIGIRYREKGLSQHDRPRISHM